jgi:hypothetical protein
VNFEDTPKVPNMLLEHTTACTNASPGPLSDFKQPGGTKNQNSNHTHDFEGHGEPTGSKVWSGSIFECAGTPKVPNKLLEHTNELANAFTGPLSD